jgi:hypothetical protein
MKRFGTLLLCGLMGLGAAHAAETWQCQLSGDWVETGQGKGRFNWNVTWVSGGEKWRLTGRANESLGKSDLNGTCDDSKCQFKQVYTSGDLDGKTFHWRANYTEDMPSDTTSVLKFKGTWGESTKAADGTWSAQGNCKRTK